MKAFINIFLFLLYYTTCQTTSPSQEFLDGYSKFSASIYKEIATDIENVIVSPFSVEIILALAQSGAVGSTRDEIRSVLHVPSPDEISSTCKLLIQILKSSDQYKFKSANKIYATKTVPIKKKFRKLAAEVYDADVENVDFLTQEQTGKIINKWVRRRTNNKIKSLVDPNRFTNYTRALLINAVYFKGQWKNRFRTQFTKKRKFFVKERDVEVDMMTQISNLNYFESESAKYVELPLRGDVSMVVILPNEKDGLEDLERDEFIFAKNNFSRESVKVTLPKFRLDNRINFKEVLMKLGVKTAFDEEKADFSELADTSQERLYISDIVQKAFIDVNENGVEAAAATLVSVGTPRTSASMKTAPKKFFLADHPFIFHIKVKDIVVFVGRLMSP